MTIYLLMILGLHSAYSLDYCVHNARELSHIQ